MKSTQEESAALKQALKKQDNTPALDLEATNFPLEAEESIWEVEQGLDTCTPSSWVASQLPDRLTDAPNTTVCSLCGASVQEPDELCDECRLT